MVAKMAPAYANIFMESVENSFLSSFPSKPTVYYRCVDNISIIWANDIDKFKQFLNNANNTYQKITLTYKATTTLTVLDVLIQINNSNTIYTTVCNKPIYRHRYLHYNGNHTIHLRRSFIVYQFLRYKRIFSDHRDFIKRSMEHTHRFFIRGYPMTIIIKQWQKVFIFIGLNY